MQSDAANKYPRVSVICPMHNVEAYVAECVQSLRAQQFANFEAIFVDDGSPDASAQVAKRAAAGDARFVFLERENGGLSAARNTALAAAQGEYVVFLDSDDSYAPQTLSRLVEEADEKDLDAVYFAAQTVYENRALARSHPESHAGRKGSSIVRDGFEMMVYFHETDSFRPSACMFMVRKGLLDKAGLRFCEGILHEDLLFTIRLFPQIKRCIFIAEPLYIRRMRSGSIMTNPRSIKNVEGLFTVARAIEADLARNAGEWAPAYIDALSERLAVVWETLARDSIVLGEDEILAYRNTLKGEDRRVFDVNVYEFGRTLDALEKSYSNSTTFKVGRVIMALPTWIKDHFGRHGE